MPILWNDSTDGTMPSTFFTTRREFQCWSPAFLDQSIAGLRERATAFLLRKGYGRLLFQYELLSPPVFYDTNSRSILASMNQMRYEIEYHLSMPETIKKINLDKIEEIEFDTMIRTGKKLMDFTTPARILEQLRQGCHEKS
jgi:hypothetical protein